MSDAAPAPDAWAQLRAIAGTIARERSGLRRQG